MKEYVYFILIVLYIISSTMTNLGWQLYSETYNINYYNLALFGNVIMFGTFFYTLLSVKLKK